MYLSDSEREAYLSKIKKKMEIGSKADGVTLKEIDQERIDKYKADQAKENAKVTEMIQPHVEYSECRKHAIIIVIGGKDIWGFIEHRWISKIPTAEREEAIIDATNEFAAAYLKRKEKIGYEKIVTPEEVKIRVQDFYDRVKEYEKNKKFRDSFISLSL